MTRLRIEEDQDRPGEGCARLVLPGFAGRSAAAVTFTREGFGADSLGPDGWQVAAGRLTPIDVLTEGDALVLVLGPEAAENLEPGPVRLGIPALGIDEVVIWPGIAPPLADRRGGFAGLRPQGPAPRRAPARVVRAAAPDPDATIVVKPPARTVPPPPPVTRPEPLVPRMTPPVSPEPAKEEKRKGRGRGWLMLLLLLLVAGGAGGAWWLDLLPPMEMPAVRGISRPTPVAEGPRPAPSTPPTPAPGPAPEAARPPEAAPRDPTETATPAEIAAMGLPPERITEIAERRQASNRAQDALLLFEFAAESQHGPALAALARLYDPASFRPGGALSAPNARKAAEYWRAAERAGDPSAAAPRAVLRDRLEQAARGGDALADLALRDFWP